MEYSHGLAQLLGQFGRHREEKAMLLFTIRLPN
jgi:hypothetical protein